MGIMSLTNKMRLNRLMKALYINRPYDALILAVHRPGGKFEDEQGDVYTGSDLDKAKQHRAHVLKIGVSAEAYQRAMDDNAETCR